MKELTNQIENGAKEFPFSDLEIKKLTGIYSDMEFFSSNCKKEKSASSRDNGNCSFKMADYLKGKYLEIDLKLFADFEQYVRETYPGSVNGSEQLDVYQKKLLFPEGWVDWKKNGVYERCVGARNNVD